MGGGPGRTAALGFRVGSRGGVATNRLDMMVRRSRLGMMLLLPSVRDACRALISSATAPRSIRAIVIHRQGQAGLSARPHGAEPPRAEPGKVASSLSAALRSWGTLRFETKQRPVGDGARTIPRSSGSPLPLANTEAAPHVDNGPDRRRRSRAAPPRRGDGAPSRLRGDRWPRAASRALDVLRAGDSIDVRAPRPRHARRPRRPRRHGRDAQGRPRHAGDRPDRQRLDRCRRHRDAGRRHRFRRQAGRRRAAPGLDQERPARSTSSRRRSGACAGAPPAP